MLVSCPQCKTKYQLAMSIKNAILVCHRCGTEFHTDLPAKEPVHADHEASLFDYSQPSATDIETSQPENSADNALSLPPDQVHQTDFDTEQSDIKQHDEPHVPLSEERLLSERNPTHIWHWFILVLLCISALGVWHNQKQWLAQPWVRSLMMNMQFTITSKPNDWGIIKDNMHSQWIDRQDQSRVLFIDGYIQNRLLSDQVPPTIQVDFFDMPNSRAIQTRTFAITEPPSLPKIRHAPYIPPAIDLVPVSAGGQRAFTLIIENVPEQARDISMTISTP